MYVFSKKQLFLYKQIYIYLYRCIITENYIGTLISKPNNLRHKFMSITIIIYELQIGGLGAT